MPRKCTGCDYTTDDPFLGTCPWCSKSLAIVSRGGNRESARVDWRRERAGRRSLRGVGGGWFSGTSRGVWVMLALVVGGLFVTAMAGGRRPVRQRAADSGAVGRVKIGMSLRDAVLALEPTPPADAVASLHDLLETPDASGTFTFCDHSPLVRVTFRHGKVTGVSSHEMGFLPGGMRQVDIQLDDREKP